MPARDRPRWGVLAGAAALGALLIAALVLIELLVDAPSRATAARLVAAAVLAIAAGRLRTGVQRGVEAQPPSTFDLAGRRAQGPDPEPLRLHQLDVEVRSAARHQRSFDAVLWPHLVALAEARTGEPAAWLAKPPGRSLGRGPSLTVLAGLIASIEGRR